MFLWRVAENEQKCNVFLNKTKTLVRNKDRVRFVMLHARNVCLYDKCTCDEKWQLQYKKHQRGKERESHWQPADDNFCCRLIIIVVGLGFCVYYCSLSLWLRFSCTMWAREYITINKLALAMFCLLTDRLWCVWRDVACLCYCWLAYI